MVLTIRWNKPMMRAVAVLLAVVLCAGILQAIYERFVIEGMTAKKTPLQLEALTAAVNKFPHSSRLQARVAEVLLGRSLEDSDLLSPAEAAAERAVYLSPFNAKYYLLIAAAKGVRGEVDAEEMHLRAALALAPHNTQTHWRLANVVTADQSLLAATMDLLWQLTEGDLAIMEQATGSLSKNRVQLAQFLLRHARIEDAVRIVRELEPGERLATPEMGEFLNLLIAEGKTVLAHQLWFDSRYQPKDKRALLSNGSFEEASPVHFSQFEWQLRSNEYAQLTLDHYVSHTGAKSLRIDFFGIDTTRLTNEIRQTTVVQPGTQYRLTCFVRTARLLTPEGPRLTVTTSDAAQIIAQTAPINGESSDWQPLTLDFTAPTQTSVIVVTIQRLPKRNYDDPTQGTIWFDDFTLTALSK
jgi:hypothetical protein